MDTINIEKTLFLVIDIQEKLVNMLKDTSIKEHSIIVAKAAGIMNIPTIITEQYPKGLGNTIQDIKNAIPNALYIEKTNFSAFEEIKNLIIETGKTQIVICGIETHICVLQTAFDLYNNGYETFVIKNACGSRNDDDKNTIIALREIEENKLNISEIKEQVILGFRHNVAFKDTEENNKELEFIEKEIMNDVVFEDTNQELNNVSEEELQNVVA